MKTLIVRAVAIVVISVCATLAPATSRADERCRQLEALRTQYSGVQLTDDQKALKVKLVAWYSENCGKREAEDVKPTPIHGTVR